MGKSRIVVVVVVLVLLVVNCWGEIGDSFR